MTVEVFRARGRSERGAIVRLVRRVASAEHCRATELSIVIVTNPEIRRLNRRFLNHNRFTDVVSFPLEGSLLGEIYVSRDQARIQARKYNVPLREEILRLVLHGFLHLLGYTHRQMQPLERKYLATGPRPAFP